MSVWPSRARFRLEKTGRERSEARGCQANLFDYAVFQQGSCAERDLGDSHGAPRADFAQVLAVIGEAPRQVDGVEQFVGGHGVLLVAGVEIAVRHAALAADGDKFDFGVVDKQCRRRVGGGRTVDEISAERGARLVGDGTDPACGFVEKRKVGSDDLDWIGDR